MLMEGWLQGSSCGSPWGPLDILQGEAPRGDVYQGHHLLQGTGNGRVGGEGPGRTWADWMLWELRIVMMPTGLSSHVPSPSVMILTWVSVLCLLPCTDCNSIWIPSFNFLTTPSAPPGALFQVLNGGVLWALALGQFAGCHVSSQCLAHCKK